MKSRFFTTLILVFVWLSLPASADAAYLGNITFDKAHTSYLDHDTYVNITIDYKVDDPAGGYVFARPYTMGFPTPSYAATGGHPAPVGTGTATQDFRISSGNHTVTHVQVSLRNADLSEVLLEVFVPVHFVYSNCGVYNLDLSHNEHDRLRHDTDLNINFDYGTDHAGMVKIFARPFTNGSLTPGYSASGSIDLPPDGAYSQNFHFDADADVTDIRFQIYNEDQSELLAELFYSYEIYWREWGVSNIEFDWADGSSLHNSQNLVSSFTFDHAEPDTVYVWTWCITDGNYTPGSVYQPSAPESSGPHPLTRYTRVNSGEQLVDAIRFIVGLPDEAYLTFDVPAEYHYAPHAVQNPVFVPAAPAILTHGEHLDIDFDYVTDDGAGVRVFCRGAFENELLFGMTSAGSPLHLYPNGVGDFWLTYTNHTEANQIRFLMTNDDQSVTHLEHFYDGWWGWGDSFVVTDVPEAPADGALLGLSYPNPFNPTTTVPVTLTGETRIRLAIYDLQGRLVQELENGLVQAGHHEFTFNGRGLASGVYLYRLETPTGVQSQRMTLIK